MIKHNTLLSTLALSALAASCGVRPGGSNDLPEDRTVLASLGNIGTKPDGIGGEFAYELSCGVKDSSNKEVPVLGTIKTTGINTQIEFQPTAENPLTPGTACRLTVLGETNTALYNYLEPKRGDKSVYHMTSVGKISDKNQLRLTSVKRYNLLGAHLFDLTIKIANPEIGLTKDAMAQIDCGQTEPMAGTFQKEESKFTFAFTQNHFDKSTTLECGNLVITSGSQLYIDKNPQKLRLAKYSQSVDSTITLEKKNTSIDSAPISAELVNQLNGQFDGSCEAYTAQSGATELSRRISFTLVTKFGENKGELTRTTTAFSDKLCQVADPSQSITTTYEFDVLNPSLVSLTNTLPVALFKIEGSNRHLQTNTIINVDNSILRFGVAVDSDLWTGSTDMAELPQTLSAEEFWQRPTL